jgi:zinc transport system ATP-binding protein
MEDVSYSWPGAPPILNHVDLSVPEGDFLAIIGPNGGGKTTLLRLILGLLKPDSGRITVMGTTPGRAAEKVGYVPQLTEFDRTFPISVTDAVLMGRLHHRGVFSPYSRRDRDAAAQKLDLLRVADLADKGIGELSGGQRQRVMIARALASEPELLLLDEPSAGIDPENQENFYNILRELNRTVTIIITTHDVGAVSSWVSRIGCMNVRLFMHEDGISQETMEKVYGCPFELITHGVPHRVLGRKDGKDHSSHD